MAVLIATADGNLTAAATWGQVDATSFLDSEASFTTLTTAYVETAAFTPGAITIDGIAVKVSNRPGATGTMSIRLAQAGALVAGTEVTINITDMDPNQDEQRWIFLKFAAPVLLLVATAYTVSAKTSSSTQVVLWKNATAGNWSRMLRTTTIGAPGAGDSLHILGEWTAAATKTNRAVTMDSEVATDYGDGVVANPPGFTIGRGGTLTWGVTAAKNYILRLSTRLQICPGGTMTMGAIGTEMPRDSSAQLEFDCAAADGDFGLLCYGTFTAQGLSRTVGKTVVRCLLNTDEAAAQTVLGVDTDTGWLNGDQIAIASTAQNESQAELRTLTGSDATTITASAGLTNAHSGTTPTQAEVILLTRNVRVQSVSATFMSYVYFASAAIVDLDWTSFRYLGVNTSAKRGVEVAVVTGSFACSYCSCWQFDWGGLYISIVGANHDNFTVDHFTGYLIGVSAAGIYVAQTTGMNWTLADIDIISGHISGAGAGVRVASYGGTLTNIRCNSGYLGVDLARLASSPETIHKTWAGFNCHANYAGGIQVDGLNFGTLHDVMLWRNARGGGGGLYLMANVGELRIEGGALFGNRIDNILMVTSTGGRGLVLRDVVLSGDSTFATINGLQFGSSGAVHAIVRCENCTFGVTSGIKVAHTNDINCTSANNSRFVELTLINCLLASGVPILNQSHLRGRSFIRYQRVNQVTNVHKTVWPQLGTVSYEPTVYRTSPPAEALTPAGQGMGEKLQSGPRRVPIAGSGTVTISAYVRKSAAYVGSAPRLIQRANPAIGVDADVVLDTFTEAADTWEQLTGTTAVAEEDGVCEFFVDCDGAAGIVYTDDWTAT